MPAEVAIACVEAGMDLVAFSEFICSLISDKKPSADDLLRIFQDQDGQLCKEEAALVNQRIVNTINNMKTALIVVDFQNDFVDGSLAIKRGRAKQDPMEALQLLNGLLARHEEFSLIVYTLDWHPSNHISFYEHCRNQDRVMQQSDKARKLKPFDVVKFENPKCTQVEVLYPSHCVKNSWGAELNAGVIQVEGAKTIRKGTDVYVDAYSGFANNDRKIKSDLEKILHESNVNAIFICGLALDICVACTAHDASSLKFLTCVVRDCCKGLSEEQIKRTCNELRARNVPYIDNTHVLQFLNERKVPWLWICQMSGLSERRRRRCKLNQSKDATASNNSSICPSNSATHSVLTKTF